MPNGRTGRLTRRLRELVTQRDGSAPSDGELLDRYVRGRDDAAFAALVFRHGPMVWGVCRRVLRDHHDAEDAFQATFLILAGRAEAVSPRDRVTNWLYGVAYRTALKARARAARRRSRARPAAVLPEPAAPEPDDWSDLWPVLDRELSRLPDRYREAILLCDLGGQTQVEAARRLGCPEGTLAARLSRGRALLAAGLTRRGVTLSAGGLGVVLSQVATAAVPAVLVSRTVEVAALVANGTTAGAVPAGVARLANGGITTMLGMKLKAVAVAVSVVGLIALGAGLLPALTDKQAPIVTYEGQPRYYRVKANAENDNLRRLEAVKWHLLRVDAEKRTLHIADTPVARAWWRGGAEELLASAASELSLVGVPVAKDAKIVLDGKEVALKELPNGVNLTVKFEADKAVVASIEATTPARAGYVVKAVDADKSVVTVTRDKDDKAPALVLPVADRALLDGGTLKDLKPGTRVRLHLEIDDGRLIVRGLRTR
jgi:RNA polymerase sigma factor (sigma-70 family)